MKLNEFMEMLREHAEMAAKEIDPTYPGRWVNGAIHCEVETGPDGDVVKSTLHFSIRGKD